MPDTTTTKDKAPWLLAPCVLLALSGITLLVPRHPAQAAPAQAAPTQAAPTQTANVPKPAAVAYDDGDGDELLEHWGDPKYAREERLQMAGMAGGFALLGVFAARKHRTARGREIGNGR